MRVRRLAIAAVLLALPASSIVVPSGALARSHSKLDASHQVKRRGHKTRTVKFTARVVRSSARGLVVRTSDGKIMSFSAKQIKRAALPKRHKHHAGRGRRPHAAFDMQVSSGNVVVNIVGLQPGALVQITETIDADGTVTITITLPPAAGQETASGVVTDVGSDVFTIEAGDGSTLRLHMSEAALSGLDLQVCSTVDVTYHQHAGILIADGANSTGTSSSGSCAPSYDATGTITQVTADSLTISGDQGPVTFSVDPSSDLTGGFRVGDLVDVTYTKGAGGELNATDVQFVEEDTSGRVTSVTTAMGSGSLTIIDDNNGQSETFNADPSNGVQINAHAFNGVSGGDQIDVSYHQSAGQLVADVVTEQ
jgi:hypothetical protein